MNRSRTARRWQRVLRAGIAAASLVAAPAAHGASLQVQSFSNSLSWKPPTRSELTTLKQQQCVRSSTSRTPGFSAGLAQARRALSGLASARALATLARDPQTHNPRAARALAAAALIENRPAAALAALLDAQERAPRDPVTLVDLASVLIQLQMPEQALAVLDGVKHLGGRLPTPMGIPLEAVLLNDRGMASLRLGRDRQAGRFFSAAVRKAPLMSGALVNRAVAQLCAGGSPSIPPPWDPPLIEPPITDPSTGAETPQASSSFDLSQGVTGVLPFIPYPTSYQQTAATDDTYNSLYNQYLAQIDSNASRSAQLTQQYLATRPSKLTDQRTTAVIQLIEDENLWPAGLQSLALAANDPPSAAAAAGVPDKFQSDLLAAGDACSGANDYDACYRPKCQAAASARNEEWRGDMVTWDNAERAYFAAYYRYATGLAANLSIPASHEQGLVQARSIGDAIIGNPMGPANMAHTWADMLVNTDCLQPPTDAQATGAGSTPASSACSGPLKAMKLSMKWALDFANIKKKAGLGVSVTCEKFEIEESTSGPVGLFASASYNAKNGEVTVVAGGKVGTDLSGPLSGNAKTGAYVKIGADGGITDVGWRFSSSGSAGFGQSAVSASDSMDFSFVPSAAGGSLLDGL